MEVEDCFQHSFPLGLGGIFQVNPEEKIGVCQKSRHQERFDIPAMQPALGSEYK
jgi:hypothetical protein